MRKKSDDLVEQTDEQGKQNSNFYSIGNVWDRENFKRVSVKIPPHKQNNVEFIVLVS